MDLIYYTAHPSWSFSASTSMMMIDDRYIRKNKKGLSLFSTDNGESKKMSQCLGEINDWAQ